MIYWATLFKKEAGNLHRLACDTHEPFSWESEPPLTFAHMPLPKSSRARPSPSIWFNCLLLVGLTISITAPDDKGWRSTLIAVIFFPVNELSMNFAPQRVDHGYFKVLIVAEALAAEVPDNFPAVLNCFGLCIELGPDYIPVRDAIFHIEEKLLHRCYLRRHQSAVSVFVPMSSPSTITNAARHPLALERK